MHRRRDEDYKLPVCPEQRSLRRFWPPEAKAAAALELLMMAGEPLFQAAEAIAEAINRDASLPVRVESVLRWHGWLTEAASGEGDWPDDARAFARGFYTDDLERLRQRIEEGMDPWIAAAGCVESYFTISRRYGGPTRGRDSE
jgi:hypothetical protein